MALNPSAISRLYVRATNWLGDAVMSLPAIRAIRQIFPHAHLAVVARPSLADLYARESVIDRVIPYPAQRGLRGDLRGLPLTARREFAGLLRGSHFDCAILLQNAFDAALMAWLAGIPERIGYRRDGRGWLLTRAIPVPEPGEIPRHERFYYLELLRRAGLLERFPARAAIRLEGIEAAREAGLRHLARAGSRTARSSASAPARPTATPSAGCPSDSPKRPSVLRPVEPAFLIFGSAAERDLCATVTRRHRRRRPARAATWPARPRWPSSSTWPPPAASF